MSPGRSRFGDQLVVRALDPEVAEVHHDRNLCDRAGFDRAIHGNPFRSLIVRGLDPDDHVAMLQRHLRRGLRIHVVDVLLGHVRRHAQSHDVQHRQHARSRPIDDAVSELFEVAPPGAAGVHHGRHPRPEAEPVGQDAVVAGPRVLHAGRGEDVNVLVDETRGHVQAPDIDHRARLRRIDVASHGRNLAVGDGDVHDRIDLVAGIDDVSALEQDLVSRLRADRWNDEQAEEQGRRESDRDMQHALIVVEKAERGVAAGGVQGHPSSIDGIRGASRGPSARRGSAARRRRAVRPGPR